MTRLDVIRCGRLALLPALALAAGACGKKDAGGGGAGGGRGGGQPPAAVRVAVAQRMDAPVTVTASGVVDPAQTVAVQSQVSGTLQSVEFREGSFVQPGQVLFRIDPRPLLAAAAQARAALARDLAQAEAARRNDTRYQTLVRQDYVAREEADQVHAAALAAAATVEADRAAVAAAEVNLSYATIRAPIAGKTGGLLVRTGNLVGPGTGPLVVINQLSPVLVRFPVLSQDLGVLQSAVAMHPLEVTAVRSDSGNVTEVGQLSFLDNSVDSLTGTVTGKAMFQNRSGGFWPGQLVFLTVKLGVQQGVLAIPSAAILTGQQGSYVYVVDPVQKTAATRNVVAGRTVGDLSIISAGLDEGATVVVDGQSRLKPGQKVAIVTGSGDGPGSVAGGGPPGAVAPQGGSVAAGNTGGGQGGGAGGDAGGAAGGSSGSGGAQPGGVTAGVQGARTNGAAGLTGAGRTGGGASVASSASPTTSPSGARSGTGNGSASPVASPLPSPVRGTAGGGARAGGAAGGSPGGVTAGATTGGVTGGAAPAGGGARP
jgi:multidrug efflux system membrane fusion protein